MTTTASSLATFVFAPKRKGSHSVWVIASPQSSEDSQKMASSEECRVGFTQSVLLIRFFTIKH